MNKAELIDQMAKDTKLPKTACKNCLESFIKSVETSLKKKKSVVLTGFGTFAVMERKERIGINPATGAKMKMDVSPWDSFTKLSPGGYIHERENTTVAPNCQSHAPPFAGSLSA